MTSSSRTTRRAQVQAPYRGLHTLGTSCPIGLGTAWARLGHAWARLGT